MRLEALGNFLFGIFLLATALIILALEFCIGWFFGVCVVSVAEMFSNWQFAFQPAMEMFFGGLFLVLVFRAYIRELRHEEQRRPLSEFASGRAGVSIFFRDRRKPLLTRDHFSEGIDGIFSGRVLLGGPGALQSSLESFRRSLRQLRLDVPRCARILEVVALRGARVSFAELEKIVPDANRFHVFQQLRDIDGVVFLLREPAGVSVIEELRRELQRLARGKIKPEPRFEKAPPPPPPVEEPLSEVEKSFRALGLRSGASATEIKSAYRKKIKECHPDKFTRFGTDWQKLAEERSKQLNAAYETLMQMNH